MSSRPHIVLVVADDLGAGDLGIGATPHLDALARRGSIFSEFTVAAPVCSASRAAILTGHYPARHSVHQHFAGRQDTLSMGMPLFLNPAVVTLPKVLRSAGYATALYGKWHLSANLGKNDTSVAFPPPDAYGLDDYAGWNSPNTWGRITARPNPHDAIFDLAISFLRRHDAQSTPAFVQVATKEPHEPHNPHPSSIDKVATRGPWHTLPQQVYYGVVHEMDAGVGRLLANLEDASSSGSVLINRTLLLFFSDNGPEQTLYSSKSYVSYKCRAQADARELVWRERAPCEQRCHTCIAVCDSLCSVGSTGGLRGMKRSLHEGGLRAPLIVHWPGGGVRTGHVDASTVMSAVDLLPTLSAIAGAELPQGYSPDGLDMSAALLGVEQHGVARRTRTSSANGERGRIPAATRDLFWEWRGMPMTPTKHPQQALPWLAMRRGPWKLLIFHGHAAAASNTGHAGRVGLHHLLSDPREKVNLATNASLVGVVRELRKAALAWQATLPK